MHTTVLCISSDCESVMSAFIGEQFDYFDDEEVLNNVLTVGDVRKLAADNMNRIGIVIDHGIFHEVEDGILTLIEKYTDDEPCKCYDVHI